MSVQISAKMVGELRESTGAGLMDCKKALVEAEGNIDEAIELLYRSLDLLDVGFLSCQFASINRSLPERER